MIFICTYFLLLILLIITYIFQTFTSFFGIIWDSLLANFGKPPFPSTMDNFNSYKSLVFTSLLGGVVIWISYQAELTSKLSIDLTKFPFNDLESLSKTNYMYVISLIQHYLYNIVLTEAFNLF